MDLHQLLLKCGGSTTYSGTPKLLSMHPSKAVRDDESHESSCRNPQATKRKIGIQDWHLLLVILSLLIINAGLMCLHILLEGIVANFNVAKIPGKEMKSTIRGVRHLNFKI